MIVEGLMQVIYLALDGLLRFNIPQLPDKIFEYINNLMDYLVAGAGILANYTPFDYLLTLFGILLVVDACILVYHFVLWILKKIPMAGMS